MGKRKGDQATPQAQDQASPAQDVAGSEPKITPVSDAGAPPATEAIKIEAPELVASPSIAAAPADAATPPAPCVVAIDMPKVEAPKVETAKVETAAGAPTVAPTKVIAFERVREKAAGASSATADTPSAPWSKMRRATPIAAAIAIAAVVGATAGSVATAGLGGLQASPAAPVKTADMRPLRDTITRMNGELAALKASIENSGRTSNAQFSKLGDRLDRVERAQAEPAAKLAKLADAVERIDRRAPAATTAAHDVTGSIAPPATQPAPVSSTRPAGPAVVDGWFVRSVYHGAALIQTRYGGVVEVEPGDNLPGLGRIENIHRQDGRWVVVTSRGMIVPR